MKRLLLAAPVLACLGAFGLVACTSNPNPGPLPPDPPSSLDTPSTSPSPTGTPPTLPPEAEGTSPKAAKAFARHYVDTINYAMATGEVTRLRDISDQACEVCTRIISDIQEAESKGWRIVGRGWKIRSVQHLKLNGKQALVGLGLKITSQRVYKSPSSSPSRSAATRGFLDVRMDHSSGRWIVIRMDAS